MCFQHLSVTPNIQRFAVDLRLCLLLSFFPYFPSGVTCARRLHARWQCACSRDVFLAPLRFLPYRFHFSLFFFPPFPLPSASPSSSSPHHTQHEPPPLSSLILSPLSYSLVITVSLPWLSALVRLAMYNEGGGRYAQGERATPLRLH